jgi:effector-binding domain-containing protein
MFVKKILVTVSLIALIVLIGSIAFLLSRPYQYRAHFNVKTTPDIVYFNIQNWDFWNRKQMGSHIEIIRKNPVTDISHRVSLTDTTLIFNWEFEPLNDSITVIKVSVSDPDRKFYNRLALPFKNTALKKSVRKNLIHIKTRIEQMPETFRYDFTGYHQFEKKSCVCLGLKGTARGKAGAMISNVTVLNQFVRQNNLELDGNPLVVIHDWDELNDSISYDFCFPIIRTNSVPEHPKIKLMTVESMDAVKTDFYGNYSITDITWHSLAEEAKEAGYLINDKLIEVYFNDPHSGGNELEWKAEIYLGIKTKN